LVHKWPDNLANNLEASIVARAAVDPKIFVMAA